MPQRNNEIEVHDERQSNKASFFNRVYDCSEKSDCQSYSDTTITAIPLSTIYIQGDMNHTHLSLIGRRHFWRKVPAGLLWLLQTFRAGGSGFSDNQCPSDWNLPFSTRV